MAPPPPPPPQPPPPPPQQQRRGRRQRHTNAASLVVAAAATAIAHLTTAILHTRAALSSSPPPSRNGDGGTALAIPDADRGRPHRSGLGAVQLPVPPPATDRKQPPRSHHLGQADPNALAYSPDIRALTPPGRTPRPGQPFNAGGPPSVPASSGTGPGPNFVAAQPAAPPAVGGAAPLSANGSDPCVALLSGEVYRVSATFQCYNSFALLPSVRYGQIEALKSTFQLYPYLDIMRNSSSPLFSSFIDLMEELDAIANDVTITTEFQFHSAIGALLKSMRDGHSVYDPKCFKAFAYHQPWVIATRYRPDGTPAMYLKSINPEALKQDAVSQALNQYWSSRGVKAESYLGYYIYRINGMDPVLFTQQYSDAYFGTSRSKDTRFNQMFPTPRWTPPGAWQTPSSILTTRTAPPADMADIRTYQLISADGTHFVTMNVPWAAVLDTAYDAGLKAKFTGRDAYYQAYCVDAAAAGGQPTPPPAPQFAMDGGDAGASALREADRRTAAAWRKAGWRAAIGDERSAGRKSDADRPNLINPDWSFKKAKSMMVAMQSAMAGRISAGMFDTGEVDLSNPLVKDPNGAMYKLDQTTGVWVLPTFAPTSLSNDAVTQYIATTLSGLSMLRVQGVSTLIIDVSNNGGGIVCAAASFLSYLYPTMKFVNYDMRRSPVLDTLMQLAFDTNDSTSFFSPLPLVLDSTGAPPRTLQEISPATPDLAKTRGGVTSNYTTKFTMDCAAFLAKTAQLPQLPSPFATVVIVSNGLCGSSCANFVRVLRDQFQVRAFVVGGRGGVFQPTSYEGGRKLTFAEVARDVAKAQATLYKRKAPAGQTGAGESQSGAVGTSTGAGGGDGGGDAPAGAGGGSNGGVGSAGYGGDGGDSGAGSGGAPVRRRDDSPPTAADPNGAPPPDGIVTPVYPLTPQQGVLLPQPLVRPASASLVFYESYAPVGGDGGVTPSEWVPQPAEELVVVEDVSDVVSVWKKVAARLAAGAGAGAGAATGGGSSSGGTASGAEVGTGAGSGAGSGAAV